MNVTAQIALKLIPKDLFSQPVFLCIKEYGTRRLFFSTIFPEQLESFCALQEKSPLNQTGSSQMQYITLQIHDILLLVNLQMPLSFCHLSLASLDFPTFLDTLTLSSLCHPYEIGVLSHMNEF